MPIIRCIDDGSDSDVCYESDGSDLGTWESRDDPYGASDMDVPDPEPPDPPWSSTPLSSGCIRSVQVLHYDSDNDDLCYQDDRSGSQVTREIVSSPTPPSTSELLLSIMAKLQRLEDKVEKTIASRNMLPTPTSLPGSQLHCDPVQHAFTSKEYVPQQHRELPARCRDSIPSVDDVNKLSLAPSRESKDRGQVICREPPLSNRLLDHTLGLRLVSSQQTNLRESIDPEVHKDNRARPSKDDALLSGTPINPRQGFFGNITRSNDFGLNIHSETPHSEGLDRSRMCEYRVSFEEDQSLLRDNEHGEERQQVWASDRSNDLGFNIHRQVMPCEDLGRVRTRPGGIPSCLVPHTSIRMRHEPWELPMGDYARSFHRGFDSHRETIHWEHLGQARIRPERSLKALVHEPLCGSNNGTWKPPTEPARSFDPGFIIHPQIKYLGDNDRAITHLERSHNEAIRCTQPRNVQREAWRSNLSPARSFTTSSEIHRQTIYLGTLDRGLSGICCPERTVVKIDPLVHHFAEHGLPERSKPPDQDQGGSSESVLSIHQQLSISLHLGVARTVLSRSTPCTKAIVARVLPDVIISDFGASPYSVWHPGDSPLPLYITGVIFLSCPAPTTKRNQATSYHRHSIQREEALWYTLVNLKAAAWAPSWSLQGLPFDPGILAQQLELLCEQRQPKTSRGYYHYNHPGKQSPMRISFVLDLMASTHPLEASATLLPVAECSHPRIKKFDLFGEVLAFSLKLLLFPFDPGKSLGIFLIRCY